jgi:hypothetical protein
MDSIDTSRLQQRFRHDVFFRCFYLNVFDIFV